jgi:hypothetical protein
MKDNRLAFHCLGTAGVGEEYAVTRPVPALNQLQDGPKHGNQRVRKLSEGTIPYPFQEAG